MKTPCFRLAPCSLLALALVAACSASDDADTAGEPVSRTPSVASADEGAAGDAAAPPPSASASAGARTLTLEGLGDLRIDQPVPEGSTFASRGAQIPGTDCRTLGSPDFPGVYAMAEGDVVKRITVGGDSPITLRKGLGVGSSEAEIRAEFPGFAATPHKYVAAPAKYLTQPGDDPRLRFEIDRDGSVSLVHVGVMPQLGYVEGCA